MDPFTKPPKPRSDVVSPGFAGGIRTRRASTIPTTARCVRSSILSCAWGSTGSISFSFTTATSGRMARRRRPAASRRRWRAAIGALDKLRNEKVIKAIGFGINEADTCVKFAKAGDFDVAMMAGRYTLIDQTGLAEFLPLALEKNMGVMLAGVFNSGILATGSGPGAKFNYAAAPRGGSEEGEGDRGDLQKAQGHPAPGGDPICAWPSRCRHRRAWAR